MNSSRPDWITTTRKSFVIAWVLSFISRIRGTLKLIQEYLGKTFGPTHKNQRVADESVPTRESIDQSTRTFPLLAFNAAAQMIKDDIASVHSTEVGMCSSDHAESCCLNNFQCLRECSRYERKKGNAREVGAVTKVWDRAEIALAAARKALYGENNEANGWVEHHEAILNGCIAALKVEDLDVPEGTVVRVFSKKESA